jgi:type I restriction enzyme M protein
VGAAELDEDDEPFEEKIARLTKELDGQFEEGRSLEVLISKGLRSLDVER